MRFGRAAFRFAAGAVTSFVFGGVGGGVVNEPAALKFNKASNSQFVPLVAVGGI